MGRAREEKRKRVGEEETTTAAQLEEVWRAVLDEYMIYLQLERGFTKATLYAYEHDVRILSRYAIDTLQKSPYAIVQVDIESLLFEIGRDEYLGVNSQARLLAGMRSFFRYLVLENRIAGDPSELISSSRLPRILPTVLTAEEVDAMEAQINPDSPSAERDLAIIEILYSCGLRVSELSELKFQNLLLDEGLLRVYGKGQKERFVPMADKAINCLEAYIGARRRIEVAKGYESTLFLNLRGTRFSRISVFKLVKRLAAEAGIVKEISPHTLRHSFATALVLGGADLRVVQAMMGHASIVTTEFYTHLSRTHLRETIEQFHPRGQMK